MLDWQIPPTWGLRKLGFLAPEESLQVVPKTQPERTFNYWGLDAISQGQFDEPQSNLVSGSSIASTCISFSNQHILYAKLRPYLNKVIVPTVDGIGTTEWIVLKPKPEFVDRYYLAYALRTQHFVDHITTSSAGARMPRARKEILFDSEIPIPYPDEPTRSLETQRRIVARLEALLAEVASARGLQESTTSDTEKLFDAFSRQVFEDIEEKYEPSILKPLTTKVGSGSTPRGGRAIYETTGIPLVRSLNVRWNEFTAKDLAYITDEIHQRMKATEVQAGDVFLNITGASIGRSCCVPEEIVPANVNQHVMIIRPIDERLRPRFLMYWLTSPNTQNFILQSQSGATRQALTKTQVEDLSLPLPPTEIQDYFVNYLDNVAEEVREMRTTLDTQKEILTQLEQSFLAQAFRGEL